VSEGAGTPGDDMVAPAVGVADDSPGHTATVETRRSLE
jgi:hypothetical protein